VSKVSDNALSKMGIARAYIQILCILEDRSAHSDGVSLFWLELFDHDAKTSVDSFSCRKIEDAVAIFEDFNAQAARLNDGTKNAVLN
jgi:hypothetical protein